MSEYQLKVGKFKGKGYGGYDYYEFDKVTLPAGGVKTISWNGKKRRTVCC